MTWLEGKLLAFDLETNIAHDVCPDWPIRTETVVGVPA